MTDAPLTPVNEHARDHVASGISRREFLKLGGVSAAGLLLGHPLLASANTHKTMETVVKKTVKTPSMAGAQAAILNLPTQSPIVARTFDHLQNTVEGISANQLKQHLGLYQGYVKKANEIHTLLDNANPDVSKVNATYDPYRELLVEASFAMNGIVLHELYFDNLGGDATPASSFVQAVFARHFGTWDGFMTQLKAAGKAMRGWAVAAFNIRDNRIHLYGLDTHNQWAPLHTIPLLVLDVYEHAYMIDFGTNRGSYLDAFVNNINWSVVEQRLMTIPVHTRAS